jgi:carbonic anhydrase/acetyltransferase-like protein (isoleucine patch superfamily)
MPIFSIKNKKPKLSTSNNFWIAPDANLIGDITIKELVSVWFNSNLRGDNDCITIGKGTNIQENCVLHVDKGYPLDVGENCTIGHRVILHGCKIGHGSLIGMGAIVLNGAVIGKNCLIGAGSLVPEGKKVPDGSLFLGSPSRFFRNLSEDEKKDLILTAKHYQKQMHLYKNSLKKN